MNKHLISDAEYNAALSQGREEMASTPRARAVRYLPDPDVLEIETESDRCVLIPRAWISALQGVPPEELARLHVWPDGSAIELQGRDVHISVQGLIAHKNAMAKREEALQGLTAQAQTFGMGY